jgi:general secretion pathway protein D
MVVDLRTIVIGNSLLTGGVGGTAPGGGLGGTVVNQASGITPSISTLPFGPTLDVIPYVSADGFSVQMTLIPSMAEFIGYDDPGPFATILQASSSAGVAAPTTAVLPLPHFRIRQVTTSVNVWDGQTVVLGGLISEDVSKMKDQVPILGDIPFLGRLFRSEISQTQKKNLLIFVTPTIIDPAGNRYHSEDEMPYYTQNSFPVQPKLSASQPAPQ